MLTEETKEMARKFALQNAIKFEGRGNPGTVIGSLLSWNEELKASIQTISKDIKEIVDEVNAMELADQIKELESTAPEMLIKEKKERVLELKSLPDVRGKVIMRMAPSPSGPMHIGHAYVTSLNYEYVKKYGGEFIFRIEDTNPTNIYMPAYEQIPNDADWLCDKNVTRVLIQSDRMEIYYEYGERLIKGGHIYICDCEPEEFKEKMKQSIACPCREHSPEETMSRWKKMFDKENGYQQGDVVARFKSDINSNNPAMRDFPLFRINDTAHPRTGDKYRVYPLMNMSVATDDADTGVTHALRGKDHADNAKRQEMIHNALGVKTPVPISVGRINFIGAPVSCSKTRPLIEDGTYDGWEDVRLPFLGALRRRGYSPEAFRRYAIEVGISKNDKTVAIEDYFKIINAHNKDILDSISNRYFFIDEPHLVVIDEAPEQDVELDLHPEHKKGGRKFKTDGRFLLSAEDIESFSKMRKEGSLIRLMDCLNFKVVGDKYEFDSTDYEIYKEKSGEIIHWLPADMKSLIPVEIVMPDNTIKRGVAESGILDLEEGHVIQFERFGFCRLDQIISIEQQEAADEPSWKHLPDGVIPEDEGFIKPIFRFCFAHK